MHKSPTYLHSTDWKPFLIEQIIPRSYCKLFTSFYFKKAAVPLLESNGTERSHNCGNIRSFFVVVKIDKMDYSHTKSSVLGYENTSMHFGFSVSITKVQSTKVFYLMLIVQPFYFNNVHWLIWQL